jgi:Fe2+ transport system protein FeoA
MRPIAQMGEGKTGTIIEIEGGDRFKTRLEAMGIRIGNKIRKISSARGKGPIVFISGRTQLAIGRDMAAKLIVKEDAANEK